jgi:hypothetical protein
MSSKEREYMNYPSNPYEHDALAEQIEKECVPMITAAEAKKIYNESGAEVEQYLKIHVNPKVVAAARSGKRVVFVHMGSIGPYEYIDGVITSINRAVEARLKELGYKVSITFDGEGYVPRGLAEVDGNGPVHRNYGFNISW